MLDLLKRKDYSLRSFYSMRYVMFPFVDADAAAEDYFVADLLEQADSYAEQCVVLDERLLYFSGECSLSHAAEFLIDAAWRAYHARFSRDMTQQLYYDENDTIGYGVLDQKNKLAEYELVCFRECYCTFLMYYCDSALTDKDAERQAKHLLKAFTGEPGNMNEFILYISAWIDGLITPNTSSELDGYVSDQSEEWPNSKRSRDDAEGSEIENTDEQPAKRARLASSFGHALDSTKHYLPFFERKNNRVSWSKTVNVIDVEGKTTQVALNS